MKLITKDTIKAQAEEKIRSGHVANSDEMIHIVNPVYGFGNGQEENFKAIKAAKTVGHNERIPVSHELMKTYGSAWDVPVHCATLDKKMSVRDMIDRGVFASANTLPADWQTMWDAMRIDISIRKSAMGTVRENFYNVINMPNSDRTFKVDEFFPYSIIFEENNGEGQSVNQGETRLGQEDTVTHTIYAAGWTWTLLGELFNKAMDPQKVSDAVLIGYNSKRDNLAMAPILNFSYSGVQQTAASAIGTLRQELLYNTLIDAIDDLGDRNDPITDRPIDPMGSYILAHPYDARHIADVSRGLPSTNERVYGGISEIAGVVSYDDETIRGRVKDTVYTGVTKGTAYLVKPNRYMNIGVKRSLTLETDMTPDVSTLAREKRAWYFVEAIHNVSGLPNFIQEITLPAW